MSKTVTTRIFGSLLFLAGLPFTIWLFCLIRTDSTIDYHVVLAGPIVTISGLLLAILGRSDLRCPDGSKSRGRTFLLSIPFIITNMLATHVAREHDFPPLEKALDSFTEKAEPREHVVTGEEVAAVIKEVNVRAAELQKIRASLNTSDVAAVKKFDLDVAAYTERNHAAAALQAKYTAHATK